MSKPKPRENQVPELDPIMRTRQEALGASLRPGPHLNQARAYSTLVRGLESHVDGPDCAYCQKVVWALVAHLSGHMILDSFPPGYDKLLAAVRAFPLSPSVSAGGTDGSDEELQDEKGGHPVNPVAHEDHQGGRSQ